MSPQRRIGLFARFAEGAARQAGHGIAFILAFLVVLAWAVSGPLFGFSDRWQLAINSFTTIVTFLMVFLIQNSQRRAEEAMQIKLDELIYTQPRAHNQLLDLEKLSEAELDRLKATYENEAEKARRRRRGGGPR